MSGGWLPPGCTDKDVDDAAPQTEPEEDDPRFPDTDYWYFQQSEAEKLGEQIQRFETWVEDQCGKGYRLSMMLMIERIIKDNKLNRFSTGDLESDNGC